MVMELLFREPFEELAEIDRHVIYMAVSLIETPEAEELNEEMSEYLSNVDSQHPPDLRTAASTSIQERGIQFIEDDHPARYRHLDCLGRSLMLQVKQFGKTEDITKAIQFFSQAIELCPEGDKPILLDSLGRAYLARFKSLRDPRDITTAIACHDEAIRRAPTQHADTPDLLNNIAVAFFELFDYQGEVDGINKAIDYFEQSISLTPDGHIDKPSRINNLAISHHHRFGQLGNLADLNLAIDYQTQVLSHPIQRDADRIDVLTSLGNSYCSRFDHAGELTDVDHAIACQTQAVSDAPNGYNAESVLLHDLGGSYQSRYQRLGRLSDIDQALAYHSKAVLLAPSGHELRPKLLASLATSHAMRFRHLEEISDIDKAITYYNEALESPHTPTVERLNNLGIAYTTRYTHLKDPEDIDKAIDAQGQATSLIPEGHAGMQALLANMGVSWQRRFGISNNVSDIDNAIDYLTQAVSLAPAGHVSKPGRLNNLAQAHHVRFQSLENLVDIEKAVTLGQEAVSLTPDGDADMVERYYDLGVFSRSQFGNLGERHLIQRSVDCFEQAMRSPLGRASTKFYAAWELAKAVRLLGHSSPMLAYKQAMDLLPQFVWLGHGVNHRYKNLSSSGHIFTEAVACAIESNELDVALEWLEQGSSVVWKQTMLLRTPFDDLRRKDSVLAERLEEVARSLDLTDTETALGSKISRTELDIERAAQRLRRLAEEWDQLLSQARLLPGFHNFLKPKTAKELIRAAKTGAVVVINVHRSRCDALILAPDADGIIHLPLPNLSHIKATQARIQLAEALHSSGIRARGFKVNRPSAEASVESVLSLLWSTVVEPVLDRLGYTRVPTDGELPHITWCSTGPLAFLPLHAAGVYNRPAGKTFEFVVSSYTPTLSGLLAKPPVPEQFSGLLAVGQSVVPGFKPIPETTTELSLIQKQASSIPFTRLEGNMATSAAVLGAMEKHSWVHLACHATQDSTDPTTSAFHLYNSQLDLATIATKSLKHAGLAFLSACQTAAGDDNLPEQAVHLAAGMIIAGYSTVIATMWSINDKDAPLIAEKVYARMLEGGVPDTRKAAKALHDAVGSLRARIGEKSFVRWVPFVHLGL
ncbi:hypothetical protein FRC10_007566 [Ceratobasidium sp. 414]|nr:hypothetical protein FRC10_007566 [Ceratobasidium sp. 414]